MRKSQRNIYIAAVWVIFIHFLIISISVVINPKYYIYTGTFVAKYLSLLRGSLHSMPELQRKVFWYMCLIYLFLSPNGVFTAVQLSNKINEKYKRDNNVQDS